jgi:hypothetical protein
MKQVFPIFLKPGGAPLPSDLAVWEDELVELEM